MGRAEAPAGRRQPRSAWADVGPMLLVLLLAGFLMTFRFDSVPPGLNGDEGFNGLHALRVLHGDFPIFFTGDNGQEPLFIYLQAAAVAAFGNRTLPIKLVPMFFGMLSVSATYVAFRAMFSRAAGVVAAAGVGTSLWHLVLSHIGIRSVSMTFLLTVALYLLWRALRGDRRRDFALAGLALGATMYTYLAARLLPALVVALLLVELGLGPRALWSRWRGLLVCGGLAALLFAPLGIYYVLHPDESLMRTSQVSVFAWQDESFTPAQTLLRTAGMFFLEGHRHVIYNLPGRPVFLPPLALFFGLGLLHALCRLIAPTRRAANGLRLHGHAWTLLWLVIMCLPSGLTYDSPQFQRATAAIPPAHALLALGVILAASLLHRLSSARLSAHALPLLTTLVIAFAAATTFRDYFLDWAQRPELRRVLLSERSHLDDFVAHAAPARVYLPLGYFPTQRFLFPAMRGVGWFYDENTLLPLPSHPEGDLLYLYPALDAMPDLMRDYVPQAVEVPTTGLATAGPVRAFLVPADAARRAASPQQPFSATFGDEVALLGYTLRSGDGPRYHPADTLSVALVWRYLPHSGDTFNFFVHLMDNHGNLWAQQDHPGWRIKDAQPDEVELSSHTFAIPADAPPGQYHLEAGVTKLGRVQELIGLREGPVTLRAISLEAAAVAGPPRPPARMVGHQLLPGLRLAGYDLSAPSLRQGEGLSVDLLWQAQQAPPRDFLVQLRLRDQAGTVWGERTAPPVYGDLAPSHWQPGSWLRDRQRLEVASQAPPGQLQLELRLLDPSSQQVLAQESLGPITVQARPRLFTAPRMGRRVDAHFGPITLLGYDLPARARAGEHVRLTLYWRATAAPDASYTVFTHLLGAGQRTLAQHDGLPADGASPTTGWVAGEVTRDDHTLAIDAESPPGPAWVEVGLYQAATGARLSTVRDGVWDTRVMLGPLTIDPVG